jgi:TonB family protein
MKSLALLIAIAAAAGAAAQDDSLTAARDLYASAAYEEALSQLARGDTTGSPAAMPDRAAYRAFCLVALGRVGEAQAIAESLLRADPLFSIDQYPDASPRIAALFAEVRMRVLPQLIKDEYRLARAHALDNAADAGSRLSRVRDLLDLAQRIGASDATLADLRLLVDGFADLARAAAPRTAAASPSPAPAAAPATSAAPPTTAATRITAPVVVSQPPPKVAPELLDLVRRLHLASEIDVIINERGTVDNVVVTRSVNPAYDAAVVAAARAWRYEPATKDGVAIRSVKTVVIDAPGK